MSDLIYRPFPEAVMSEGFGGPRKHAGEDYAVPVGAPVRAVTDGVIVFVGGDGARGEVNGVRANGEGKTVDMLDAVGRIHRSGHLDGYNCEVGQRIRGGIDVIAFSGNTGYSTGPHLHQEVRWNRGWGLDGVIDPNTLPRLDASSMPAAGGSTSWEDLMKPFGGQLARTTVQTIDAGKPTALTFLDRQEDSAYGNRTICRGPGDVVGLVARVRLKGKPGARVELQLVRETADNVSRVVLCEERRVFDSLGVASAHLAFSGPLGRGQLVRVLAHVQAGAGESRLERLTWSGYARSAA